MSLFVLPRSLAKTLPWIVLVGICALTGPVSWTRADDDPKDQPQAAGEEARYLGMSTSYWVNRLSAPDAKSRRQAVEALAAIGPEGDKAVPALVKALEDEDVELRLAVLDALGEIGPKAKQAAPVLARAIKDKNSQFSRKAAIAAGRIKCEDKEVIHALISQLQNYGYDGTGPAALDALRAIGPPAVKTAFPALVALFKRGPYQITESNLPAGLPLAQNGLPAGYLNSVCVALLDTGDQALPVFLEGLKSNNVGVQKYAIQALRPYGAKGSAAVPILADQLKKMETPNDGRPYADDFGDYAVAGLVTLGPCAEASLVDLIGCDKAGDWVARALARNHPKEGLPTLVAALKQGSAKQRIRAANALGQIGSAAREAVPVLQELTSSEDAELRRAAQNAIQAISVPKTEGRPF